MIPVNVPDISEGDVQAVVSVLREGWISGDAPVVGEFERFFAQAHGQQFGIAVANGSLALDLVFATLDVGAGDEVILPSFTIASCLFEILRRGAVPVFIDADPVTWNMDVARVRNAISPRTVAILAVHIYGLPVDMDPLLEIGHEFGITILEDSAEAHGLRYKEKVCGSMGYASTFSFYANKNVTTGEGGMILTSDEDFAERLRFFRNLCFQSGKRFVHEEAGWNMRLSALQAALGLSQLGRLEESISRRREMASRYREMLTGIAGVSMAPEEIPSSRNDYWVVGVTLSPRFFPTADVIATRLAQNGLQTRPFFFPLHKQPVYQKSNQFRNFSLPVSEYLGNYGFYLPNGLGMSEDQLEQAVAITRSALSS